MPSTQKTKFTLLCYYAFYLAEKGLAPQHTWPLCRMPRFQWDSRIHGSTHATAHTTTLFVSEEATKASLILPKMCIVIRNLVQEDRFPCCSLILLIPAWTHLSRGLLRVFPPGGTTTRVLKYMAANIVAVDSHTNPRTVQIHLSVTNLDI